MKWDNFLQKLIVFLFSCLFFLVPLFFTPFNSELFEFNKMILTYILTVFIVAAWLGRMILQKRFIFRKTPLDIPLLLFFLSQVLSFWFSLDRHTSIFGYYSRFNGGLLSIITYLLLYYALTTNCEPKNVLKFLRVSLIAGFIVSIYGILEHFGHSFSCLIFEGNFNVSCWLQKVQDRVFATLGQPNWLAAYLAILIPISLGFALNSKFIPPSAGQNFIFYFISTIVLYACLVFTGSRSGFLGLVFGLIPFWILLFILNKKNPKTLLKPFLIFTFSLLTLNFLFGSPFSQLNKIFYYKPWQERFTQLPSPAPQPEPMFEGGISQSSDIRKVVWKGAFDIFKAYPLFGSGVETFAYAYYQFRPVEHNLLSEWDFLYNKAHNDYLNYLATTGAVGLGTYLILITSFIIYSVRKCTIYNVKCTNKNEENYTLYIVHCALFSGWLTILVSNFFGFSVVLISLYFYLIPAFCLVLTKQEVQSTEFKAQSYTKKQLILFILLFFTMYYVLCTIINLWRADYYFALGEKLAKRNELLSSYQSLVTATNLSPNEPVILNELSSAAANLALLADSEKDASTSSLLTEIAVINSDKAIEISPRNLNVYKTRTRVFYTLSSIESQYLENAIRTLEQAMVLAPTDPKVVYNLGLLYAKNNQALKAVELIEKSIELKPNYEEARSGLALFYEDLGLKEKALEQLEYLLKIKPDEQGIKERIEKLRI